MHIERKMIIILSVLLLVAIASLAVMMANNKSTDSLVVLKSNSINKSISQEPNNIVVNNTTSEIKEPLFQVIVNGVNGGDSERGNYILTKSTEWKDLWTKMNYDKSPIPALPDVDFSKEIIIAVFQGRRYTSGYSIQISNIDEKANGITIFVKEYSPGANCITSQVLTYPFYIVKIPRTTKDMGFSTEEIVVNC